MNRLAALLESENLAVMYHGGTQWRSQPEIRGPRQGKYEAGPGIYLTNYYNRARSYAGGNKTVMRVLVDLSQVRLAQHVELDPSEAAEFIKSIRMKNREGLLAGIDRTIQRRPKFTADTFINLIVNNEAGAGQAGVEIAKWLASKGVTASLEKQRGNEEWLVVIDPAIIQSYSKLIVGKGFNDWELPTISSQLTSGEV